MATAANAAVTPQQITNALGSLTQKAKDLNAPAQSITVLNVPLIIIGQGPFPVCLRLRRFPERGLHLLTHSRRSSQASATLSQLPMS